MTEQELLAAILEATSPGPVEAMTTEEIVQATGLGVKKVRATLKRLIADGKVTPVWVTRDTLLTPLSGTRSRVPGYVAMGHGGEA